MLFGHHNNDDANQPAADATPPVQISPSTNPLAVDPATGVSLPVAENETPQAVAEVAPQALADAASSFGGLQLPPPPEPITPSTPPPTAPLQDDVAPAGEPAAVPAPAVEPPISTTPEPAATEPDVTPNASALEPMPAPQPALTPDPALQPVQSLDETSTEAQPSLAPAATPAEDPATEPVMPFDEPGAQPAALQDQQPAPTPGSDDLLSLKQQALTELTPLVDKLDQSPEERFRTKMMMIQSTDDQSLIKDAYEAAQAIADEKNRAQALLDIINEINYFTSQSNQ